MGVLITILSLFAIGIGGFYIVCHIVKLWTGCNTSEAISKLHNFINGKALYTFNNDIGFANAVWDNVKNIIGDSRFNQLLKLSQTAITTPLLSFGENSGLPYIAVSLYYSNDNEKQVIENILSNLVVTYLKMYGYGELILTDWKIRYDLNMPFLEIRYARTTEEQRILNFVLQSSQEQIISRNSDVVDDTEVDNLNE